MKPKFKIIPGVPYSITINPNYWQQNSRVSIEERCKTFMSRMSELIRSVCSNTGIFIQLYPDMSQPLDVTGQTSITGGGRMHLHGWVLFRDWSAVRTFYFKTLPQLTQVRTTRTVQSANINIDSISSISTWVEYSKKSINTMWPNGDYISNIPDDVHEFLMDYTDPKLFTYRPT